MCIYFFYISMYIFLFFCLLYICRWISFRSFHYISYSASPSMLTSLQNRRPSCLAVLLLLRHQPPSRINLHLCVPLLPYIVFSCFYVHESSADGSCCTSPLCFEFTPYKYLTASQAGVTGVGFQLVSWSRWQIYVSRISGS